MYKLKTQRLGGKTVRTKKFPYSTILDLTSAISQYLESISEVLNKRRREGVINCTTLHATVGGFEG